ncbi:DUF4244 domain-containing protein [Curtobacterium sp. RHCJP20]|uniref:DUF4244 domain-containing protein n=1 Tax=Curtobacterium subtropicum TaxID=3055138 RepID=A0ABT7TGP5_9MICO|nr:DUF4244 domain-containing protein [Curtobacterium subtropicum]MDM7888745.1 DUF4244 domain-containing protein [Curtobacterium subtropicum]
MTDTTPRTPTATPADTTPRDPRGSTRRPVGEPLGTHRPRSRRLRDRLRDDRGSATAEYAVVILAAVAFAGVLVAVMRSGEVQQILTDLVRGALVP